MHMKSTVQVAIFFLIWHYFPETSIIDIPIFVLNIPAETSESIRYTPQDYIVYLGNPGLSIHKIYTCMESLRIILTNNPLTWVHDFVCEGLNQVLTIPNECYRRCVSIQRHTRSLWKCQMFNSWYDYTGTREMGQGPTRVHPLPKSHLQQSWIEETFWAHVDASCTFFRPVPAGRDGWGRQTDDW